MDVSDILDSLNDKQREAVAAAPGPLLVLAGAGSGKTRVLTHRVTWLVSVENVMLHGLLAVTFTNKAAQEMRGRIEQMLNTPVGAMWIGTFHGLSHRLLRAHWREAGLPQSFQIIDSDDQYRLIKRVIRNLGLDEAYWPVKQVQWFINGHKDAGRRPKHLPSDQDPQQKQLLALYEAYENQCRQSGLVDFAELLLRSYELLRDNDTMRRHYHARFRHILVDEFQDTNTIQYKWLKLFVGKNEDHSDSGYLFVVGDDDQSIYGWRGARVENILQFQDDYPTTKVIRMEQNYRSSGNILKAANNVIGHNTGRMGKNLWTADDDGELINLYTAYSEVDEANFVIDKIREHIERGQPASDCAILYRSNAQSRTFEEILLNAAIPYRVYGGLRFFERAEIKDALAYLRLLDHRDSDHAFERIANVPTRGIGNKTMEAVRQQARTAQLSMWQAAQQLLATAELSARACNALRQFMQLIELMAQATAGLELPEIVEHMLQHSGLLQHHKKEKGEKGEARVENLEELVTAVGRFEHNESDGLDPLSSFLAHAALEAGEGQARNWEDCVQLMSLHSAKGLEFPLVFLTGMEEGLFPHARSIDEPGRLEEERRLCYVGMTRAMRYLYMTYAEVRRLHGREQYAMPSRFLDELPGEHVHEVRPSSAPSAVTATKAGPETIEEAGPIRLGQQVRHSKFGDGVVVNCEGQGQHARIQVNFTGIGSKWLVLAYADLTCL